MIHSIWTSDEKVMESHVFDQSKHLKKLKKLIEFIFNLNFHKT